jgi:hypothetical protein
MPSLAGRRTGYCRPAWSGFRRSRPHPWCHSGKADKRERPPRHPRVVGVVTDDTEETTMAEDRMAVLETVRKAISEGDVDFLREGGARPRPGRDGGGGDRAHGGAPRGARDPERRLTRRNGYRERRWDTRMGTVELAIPRVRDGSYFPSLLEPRRRAERALLAVVQEAYLAGVSTRRVEDRTDGATSAPSRWRASTPSSNTRRWAQRCSWRAD